MEGPFEDGLLQPHDVTGLDAIHGSLALCDWPSWLRRRRAQRWTC